MRENKVEYFMNLKQGFILVTEYSFKFTQLSKYALEIFPDSRAHISKFIIRVSKSIVKECRITMLIGDMDITRLIIHGQKIKAEKLNK